MERTEWVMRDGRTVKLNEMTTLHIQNCVKMLKNNVKQREQFRPMIKELQSLILFLESGNQKRFNSTLDQADTDLMVADTILDEQQAFSQHWINIFETELIKRESN